MDLDQILQNARHNAAAGIFAAMSSEEKSQQLLAQVRVQSDAMIDFGARYKGVPTDQLEIYRAMVRGQGNPFNDELSLVSNLLKAGDVLLSTGNTIGAKIITKGKKKLAISTQDQVTSRWFMQTSSASMLCLAWVFPIGWCQMY